MAQEYQFQPLDTTQEQIRLVKLIPGNSLPVRIKIFACGLKSVAFDALSYPWGSSVKLFYVECEGCTIRVRHNLFHFLQSLRQFTDVPPLWIDAISIDTSNDSEKGRIVPQMPLIYRTARRTLCWTGYEDFDSLKNLISMTLTVGAYQQALVEAIPGIDILHPNYRVVEKDLEIFKKAAKMVNSNTWRDVNAFLDQGYFQRLLLMQDIICSQNPVIYDLNGCIPWSQLSQVLFAWLFFSPESGLRSPGTMFVLLSECMRRGYLGLNNKHITLPNLLVALRSVSAHCAFPNDYVYSAYSIAKSISPNETIVNNTLNTRGVYIQASQNLNILSCQPLSLSLKDDFESSQPSWSTNWKTRTKRFLLNCQASSFSASRGLSVNKPFMQVFRPPADTESVCLQCTGFIVDTIRKTSDYLPPRRHFDHYILEDNCFFFAIWYDFARDYSRRTEETVLLDYADTIQARGCGHLWEDPAATSQDRIRKAQAFLDFLSNEDAEESDITDSIRLFHAACFPSHDRRFAVTKSGRFCLVPKATRKDDLVCVPCNSRVPYIFRPHVEGIGHLNIGEAFVHGIMHGELNGLKDWESTKFLLY